MGVLVLMFFVSFYYIFVNVFLIIYVCIIFMYMWFSIFVCILNSLIKIRYVYLFIYDICMLSVFVDIFILILI